MGGKTGHFVGGNSAHSDAEIEQYGRIPDSVMLDKSLSVTARLVYAYLARHVYQGTIVRVGQRRIAEQLGLHKETVMTALAELQRATHIDISGEGQARRIYHLRSNLFGQKQRAGVTAIVSSPTGSRMVTVGEERMAG